MSAEVRLQCAMRQEKISHIESQCLINSVGTIVRNTFLLAGFTNSCDKNFALLSAKLASDLTESYSYMTLGEVEFCFECGVKGAYGEFHGINMRTFCKWLQCYKTSDIRYKALVAKKKEEEQKALPQVSEAYKQEQRCAWPHTMAIRPCCGALRRTVATHGVFMPEMHLKFACLHRRDGVTSPSGRSRHSVSAKWGIVFRRANQRRKETCFILVASNEQHT